MALLCIPAVAAAEDVAALKASMDGARAELAKTQDELATERRAADAMDQALAALGAELPALEQARDAAREAMDAQYQRIIADPTLDLTATRADYRAALEALAAQAAAREAKQQEIADARQRIAGAERATAAAEAALAEAQRAHDLARVARLHKELNAVGEIRLSHSRRCEPDDTIAGCIDRTEAAAREIAKQRFVDQVFGAVTEAQVVAQRRDGVSLEVALIDSTVINGQFKGRGDYDVELEAKVSQRVSEQGACALLGLTPAQCAAGPAVVETPASPPPTEDTPDETPASGDGSHVLTVRSNVFYDEVFIDGVAYGSTKVAVNLPAGAYDVEVRKPGHRSWRGRVELDRDRTVTAELQEP